MGRGKKMFPWAHLAHRLNVSFKEGRVGGIDRERERLFRRKFDKAKAIASTHGVLLESSTSS